MSDLFGLWRNGWCCISVGVGDDHMRYAGTLDEVTATRVQFIKEGQPPHLYEIVEFDSMREPPAVDVAPTPTQLEWLESIDERGRYPWPMHSAWRQTASRMIDNGWFVTNVDPEGRNPKDGKQLRLTAAGKRALARGRKERTP